MGRRGSRGRLRSADAGRRRHVSTPPPKTSWRALAGASRPASTRSDSGRATRPETGARRRCSRSAFPAPPVPPPAISPSTAATPASTVATLPLANVSLTRVATRRFRARPPRLEPAQRRRHRASRGGDLGPARAAGAHRRSRPRVRRSPPRARGRARGACICSPRAHHLDCRRVDRDRRDRRRRRRCRWRPSSSAQAVAGRCACASSRAAPGGVLSHSRPQTITRRPVTIALALDAGAGRPRRSTAASARR